MKRTVLVTTITALLLTTSSVASASGEEQRTPPDATKAIPDSWAYSDVTQSYIDARGADRIEADRARGRLLERIESIPGVTDAGYLISGVDDTTGGLKILWHGSETARKEEVRAAARDADLPVAFVDYPFSWKEVDEQARKIAAMRATLSSIGFELSGVSTVAFDRPSLVAEGSLSATKGPTDDALATKGIVEAAQELVKEAGSLPVDVRISPRFAPIDARPSRTTDVSAFSAGGFMRSFLLDPSASSVCSSGFTLRINDVDRPTTARHCRPAVAGGSWRAYNADSSSYGDRDIRGNVTGTATLASTGIGWTFDGGPGSSDIVPVRGMQKVGVGDLVCTDGGNSGVHCDGKIVDVRYLMTSDEEGDFYTMRAEQVNKNVLGVSGDSGGPVIVPWADGFGAVGILQAAGGVADCGTTNHPAVDCGWAVLFSDIYSVSADLGGTLVTG